ncbi:NADH:flavin oxidoreductase/NADH oxidase [Rhodopseudomonas infernalis]|uniref:NADH:flavin oxidoreductase/NADH oxidase n=1 Tax=Rhodopseudomonas infernalis TaxID=2897386 RepID=UPI001EE93688|nr:NADH:flavin oxidoreductase/NADH oxidase [Rhodopseudomonas infernalis]
MPSLFSELKVRDVTLRNRIAVSPMTQFSSPDGIVTDWHLAHLGSKAVGGAGMVVVEQAAVSPEGRMSTTCAGLWNDEQGVALARLAGFVSSVGCVPGIQLGHSGRRGCVEAPWLGGGHLPADHPDAWEMIGPSAVAFGGVMHRTPREMTLDDIAAMARNYAAAARRAREAGFAWLEIHAAHGFLLSSFFSPLSNHRTDQYGGDFAGRSRFLLEVVDAVRAEWPDRLPLSMRFGVTEFAPGSQTIEESVALARMLKPRGVDLVDVSFGGNSGQAQTPWDAEGFMVPAAERIRREADILTAANWNLADPHFADAIVREARVDLVMLGRPMLANPHWPVYAAMVLGHERPYDLLPVQFSTWLNKYQRSRVNDGFGHITGRATVPEIAAAE